MTREKVLKILGDWWKKYLKESGDTLSRMEFVTLNSTEIVLISFIYNHAQYKTAITIYELQLTSPKLIKQYLYDTFQEWIKEEREFIKEDYLK